MPFKKIFLALVCLGMLAGSVPARSRSSVPAKKPTKATFENRDNLEELGGKKLAGVWSSLQKDLAAFAGLEGEGKDALADMKELRASYRRHLQAARKLKARDAIVIFHDTYLVYSAQGLEGMNRVLEGIGGGSKAKREEGWTFVKLALRDMDAVYAQLGGKPASSGGGSRTAGQAIGRSFAFNGTVSGDGEQANVGFGLTASFPLNDKVDWGTGLNMDVSADGDSSTLGLGVDLFVRYNFINFLPEKPWIVPFVGANLGSQTSSTTDVFGDDSSNSNFNTGVSTGLLVFMSRQIALNTEFRLTRSTSSSDQAAEATSNTTFSLNTGIRVAY